MERVEREQGQDQREPDHVHKRHRHQDPHPRHRLAPSPRTTALTTIRITPNAAATPSSETRRRSEEHTSELQSPCNLVCRLLLEKKKNVSGKPKAIHPTNERMRSIL